MSDLVRDLASATHRFQVREGYDPTANELIKFLREERDRELERQRVEREKDRRRYAQVRFSESGAPYAYAVEHCCVGDYIVVPPNSVRSGPTLLKVVKLGRETDQPCRPAQKVDQRIAFGLDYGSAGRGTELCRDLDG